MKITHYDLFAGIGGFSLALDEIFYDKHIKHIFCEWESFPTAVLRKHWPEGIYYGDIRDLIADTAGQRFRGDSKRERLQHETLRTRDGMGEEITILTGGFPCQPFSHAGRRQGTSDDRYKWPDMFAVIRNVRPDWVIAENVRGLVTWNDGMVLETVCADLESEGYEVQPLIIPAVAVGAPHRRDRVWIVAHTNRTQSVGAKSGSVTEKGGQTTCNGETDSTPWELDGADRKLPKNRQFNGYDSTTNQIWNKDWREVAFTTCHDGVDDGLPRWMDGTTISASRHRKERLKACGNAIVPQVAMEIFKAIRVVIHTP